jgi:putative tricarboxylic transport membrane protein
MHPGVRSPEDFWTGLLLFGFGTGFGLLSLSYNLGSTARIGAGAFPLALACALALIGVAAILRSLLRPGAPVGAIPVVPMVLVLSASLAFGILLTGAGLAAAIVVVVIVSAHASRQFFWPSAILLAGAMSAGAVLVFVYALQLPVPIVGRWLTG